MTPLAATAYGLLAAALLAVWLPARVALPAGPWRVPAWVPVFALACAAALTAGVLQPLGLVALLALAALLWPAKRASNTAVRAFALVLAAVYVLLLSLHAVPGFANVRVLDRVRFTADAAPFTLYLNFDKGAAGLLVLAMLANRAPDVATFARAVRTGALACAALVLPVAAIGAAIGWFELAPKLPPQAPLFLAVNLLFVCAAEDAFFRTFVQQPLHAFLDRRRARMERAALARAAAASAVATVHPIDVLPVLVAAAAFGLAHAAGGWQYVLLAAVAGAGYAWAYARTRCVEAAIAAHFCTNALHFFLFTYPRLAA